MNQRYTPRSIILLRGFFDFGEHFMNIPITAYQWAGVICLALFVFFSYPFIILWDEQARAQQWPNALRKRMVALFYTVDVAATACIVWIVWVMLLPFAQRAA